MNERYLKVYEASGNKRNVPRTNLQGDWLSALVTKSVTMSKYFFLKTGSLSNQK